MHTSISKQKCTIAIIIEKSERYQSRCVHVTGLQMRNPPSSPHQKKNKIKKITTFNDMFRK